MYRRVDQAVIGLGGITQDVVLTLAVTLHVDAPIRDRHTQHTSLSRNSAPECTAAKNGTQAKQRRGVLGQNRGGMRTE